MAENKTDSEPTLVDQWLQDQQKWQRTALAYLDSMVNNDEFLVHMGNAMRGSLLAGKPYPTAPASAPQAPSADGRLDQVLYALHQLQGQVQDLSMTLEEIRGRNDRPSAPPPSDTLPNNSRRPIKGAAAPSPAARSRKRQERK